MVAHPAQSHNEDHEQQWLEGIISLSSLWHIDSDCTVDGNFQRKKTQNPQNSVHIPDNAHIICFPFDPKQKYGQGSVPHNKFNKINQTF